MQRVILHCDMNNFYASRYTVDTLTRSSRMGWTNVGWT